MNKSVITLAGGSYLPGAAVQAMELKAIGCDWPHVLFTVPGDEISRPYRRLFSDLDVEIRQITGYLGHPWTAKRNAIQQMPKTDVLFLDADNIPLIDPEIIRLDPRYQNTGSIFWRDFETMPANHPLYALCGVEGREQQAQEAGQLMINTERCAMALDCLAALDANWKEIYEITRGDKDMWRMAWLKSWTPWEWGSPDIGIILDDSGNGRVITQKWGVREIFHHRVHAKFSLEGDNWWRPGIPNSLRWLEHLEAIRSKVL